METIEKREAYVYGVRELNDKIKEFISDVNKLIKENNYHLSDESEKALLEYESIDWKTYLGNKSKSMRKKFNKYLYKYNKRRSVYSANLFFHFLHTRILSHREVKYETYLFFNSPDWISKVKIQPSLKEQEIQAKRKEWIIARDNAFKALKEYKDEKGNFYKS